jgi:hypothetical protein
VKKYNGGENSDSAVERLTGEASIVLEELMRQAPEARESSELGVRTANETTKTTRGETGSGVRFPSRRSSRRPPARI